MGKKHEDGKLDRKTYEKELRRLQEELCYLQAWVKAKGERRRPTTPVRGRTPHAKAQATGAPARSHHGVAPRISRARGAALAP